MLFRIFWRQTNATARSYTGILSWHTLHNLICCSISVHAVSSIGRSSVGVGSGEEGCMAEAC
jgi:hypothetical protein